MTEGEITVREDSLSPAAVRARMDYARAMAASSLLPDAYRQQPANVLLAVEYGQALGIRPIAALTGINVIKGRPTMSADLMASVVRQAGHKLRIEQRGMSVRATLIRSDDPDFTFESVWDEQRATQAGLWGQRGPWSQYPEQMLRSRAITEVCRQGASDCLYGAIYAPEELGGVEEPRPLEDPEETRARLNQECSDLVHSFVAHFGGDPEEIARAWEAENGTADPAALKAWLTARIPTTNETPTNPTEAHDAHPEGEVVEAEIIEEDQQ